MLEPLAELLIADSRFLGMCSPIANEDEALRFQGKCQKNHPEASHVALVWRTYNNTGWDEDGEPPNAVGPQVVEEVSAGYALVLVRYFHGQQLLGVTCGRLSQCYRSVARDTMHRYLHPNQPYERDCGKPTSNMYGLGAGDCELILNVIPEEEERDEENGMKLVERIRAELNFDGFRGAQGETLPRLQNLQADLSENAIPIYRYPGNYSGQEWKTFQWSPTSLMIKEKVEGALQPIFAQTMNHCVTNYYRDGHDFISHHSDKDLDLNPEAVIVSVSLGDERVLELKRRSEPRDVTRLVLPHRSMLVLGPITNRLFSHSILPKEDSTEARISLTFPGCPNVLGSTFGKIVWARSERLRLPTTGAFQIFVGERGMDGKLVYPSGMARLS